jgi:ABC-2 type transport system permease protein/oleandomycin transport system permease protein
VLERFDLVEPADRLARTYSGGMRRRLDLAVTLIGQPALILLDEPTAGLDPRSRNQLWELVEQIAAEGTTVLLTSQYLDEVERLAKRIVVIDRGVMIADGSAEELKRSVGEDLGIRRPSLDDVFFALTADGANAAPLIVATPRVATAVHDTEATALAMAASPTPHRAIGDMTAITRRYLLRFVRIPQLLFLGTVQPVLFVLMLNAVFGGLVSRGGGGSYIQYLVPGAVVMSVMFGVSVTSAGLAEDLQAGVIDRFRSLPMSRAAVLVGRTVADLVRTAIGIVLVVVVGLVMGYELHGIAPAAGAFALILLFAYALSWLFASVGMAVKQPEVAQLAGFLPVMPLVFLSGAWIPIETMSGGLQAFARNQPVNVLVEALRALGNGGPAFHWVWQSIAWSTGILLISIPVCIRQYSGQGA